MRIAVTVFYTESYLPLAAITIPVLEMWCKKHKYHFNEHIITNETFPHFVKTNDAKELLDAGYDYVFALECDMLLTNLNYKIEDFINDTHDFFITKDMNGFNSGSFIVRNSDWGKAWLDFINRRNTGTNDEQDVIIQYADSSIFESKICVLGHPAINSIPYEYYDSRGYVNFNGQPMPTHEQGCWRRNDFCVHLPGKTLLDRINIFSELQKHIVYD